MQQSNRYPFIANLRGKQTWRPTVLNPSNTRLAEAVEKEDKPMVRRYDIVICQSVANEKNRCCNQMI
uniref:Uncharacterized protein n=1 Tax=Manihot esculenta TaxID=3983 RepID=A0A2C9VX63_MANES